MKRSVTIRWKWIKKAMDAMCGESQRLKHLLHEAFKKIKDRADAFRTLEGPVNFPIPNGCYIRIVDITHQSHDYRLLYLHRDVGEDRAFVDFLAVFRRRNGYAQIDWAFIERLVLEQVSADE